MWKIPLFETDFRQDEVDSIIDTINSNWISMGTKNALFEMNLKKYLNEENILTVNNGTAALHLSTILAGFKPGDEVIIPSLTFVATGNAVLYTGATPVFVDIASMETPIIGLKEIVNAITPKTKGIIVMHYAGFSYEIEEIANYAKANNIVLIEDAAHAIGGEVNNKKVGTFGDFGCFSFYANKNMTTGEGGAVFIKNRENFEKMKRLRSHGMSTLSWDKYKGHNNIYDVSELGYNYRLDDLRASLGIVQLKKLNEFIKSREKIVKYYHKSIENIDLIKIPFYNYHEKSSYHFFPIIFTNQELKKHIKDLLEKEGIQTSVHYPPVHLFTLYKDVSQSVLPLTEKYYKNMLTLPLYPSLEKEKIELIVKVLKDGIDSFKKMTKE